MRADLVFRGAHHECAHKPKKISALGPELVFCEVPGKSLQGGGQTQRFGRLLPRPALQQTVAGGVIGIAGAPARLGLLPPSRLALRPAAGVLAIPNTRIRPEPPAADGAGSLPGLGHRDSS